MEDNRWEDTNISPPPLTLPHQGEAEFWPSTTLSLIFKLR